MSGAYIRSLRWADWLVNALTDPRALARQISSHASGFVPASFLFPVISSAVVIVSWSLLSVQSTFFFTKITYGWILLSLGNAAWALLISLLIGLGLQFSNVQGNLRALLTLANFSQLPGLFILPAAAVFSVLGFAPVLFLVLFLIVTSVWGAYILVMGVCELYSLTFSRAAALYLIPCGALFVAAAVFIISGGALIVGRIMTL